MRRCSSAVGGRDEAGHPAKDPRCRAAPSAPSARSDRRIAPRGLGVGIAEASSASADPAAGPWRSTARSCQLPGTPRSSTVPRSSKPGTRADDQIAHGARHEDFAGVGLRRGSVPRCVPRCPPISLSMQFALAGVNACADVDAQGLGLSTQRLGAPDCLCRAVEGGEVTVAGAFHHRSVEALRKCSR